MSGKQYSHAEILNMIENGDADLAWMAPEIIYQLLGEIDTLKKQCPFCEGQGTVSVVNTVKGITTEVCGFCHGSGECMSINKAEHGDQPA